jgi:putative ABC transport system substrate-binding protein
MRRRDFIAALLPAATLARAKAREHVKPYHLALVGSGPGATIDPTLDYRILVYRIFLQELREVGYVVGQNLILDLYSRREHFDELARDVVRQEPDVIITTTVPLARAFKQATATIPIVGFAADPIGLGLINSLAQPGGNLTGVTIDAGTEIWGKRLELLKEISPHLSKVGFLGNRATWEDYRRDLEYAAQQLGCLVFATPLLEGTLWKMEYDRALAAMVQDGAEALIVADMGESFTYGRPIVDFADTHQLPVIFPSKYFAQIGGLMSYGAHIAHLVRHVAHQIDRILKGANPGDIPFYQATQFELVLNLKTAKTLGLAIPPSLVARADEVIE